MYIYVLMNRWTFTNETEILNLVESQYSKIAKTVEEGLCKFN